MKVPTQKSSAVGVHPPSSKIDSSHSGGRATMRRVCQTLIEQLGTQLSVVSVWLVCQDPDTGKRQTLASYSTQEQPCFRSDLPSYLESEVWLVDSLPVLSVSELAIATASPNTGIYTPRSVAKSLKGEILDNHSLLTSHSTHLSSELQTPDEHKDTKPTELFAYVCVLNQHSDGWDSNDRTAREYLLLCTQSSLSQEHQQYVEQQAQLLSSCLAVFRESSRQRATIQLLEQAIQRTEHQLRNTFALIGLYSENLYRGLPAGSLQEQAMIIRETVNEVSANLTDLVYCGQEAKLSVAPYDLRMILVESLKGLQACLEPKQLCINYPDEPCILWVDRWQIKQVFDNLLSNAVHFSPQGGTVTCNWRVFATEAIVEIRDRGSGLSEEDLKQAFTPFYSRRPGGTGLGLAIAKKIVLDHQGSLWVQNLPGGGAQFSFILPRK